MYDLQCLTPVHGGICAQYFATTGLFQGQQVQWSASGPVVILGTCGPRYVGIGRAIAIWLSVQRLYDENYAFLFL